MSNGDDIPSYTGGEEDTARQANRSLANIEQNTADTNTFFKNTSFGKLGGAMGTITTEGINTIRESFDTMGKGMEKMYEANIKNVEQYRKVFGLFRGLF